MNKANLFTLGWIILAALLALAGCQPYMAEPQGGAQILLPAGTVTLEPYPPPQSPKLSTAVPMSTETATPPSAMATPVLPVPTLALARAPVDVLAGEKIAFLKDDNLQLINVARQTSAQVSTSGNVTHIFGWSHDGSQLLLGIGERPIPPETDMLGGTDLWVLDVQEGKAEQLTKGLDVLAAAWSPIAHQIAYSTRNDDLYLVKSDGTEGKLLVTDVVGGDLAWSPDGSELAYVQMQHPGDWAFMDIVVIKVADGSTHQLTSEARANTDPQWSLDGRKILFQSDRTGTPGTGFWWAIDADGSNLSHLEPAQTVSNIGVGTSKSPVTDQVAFADGKDIWVMNFRGEARKIAEGSDPSWSPDGNKLVYVGKDNGIWIVNVDGTGSHRLYDTGIRPSWSK